MDYEHGVQAKYRDTGDAQQEAYCFFPFSNQCAWDMCKRVHGFTDSYTRLLGADVSIYIHALCESHVMALMPTFIAWCKAMNRIMVKIFFFLKKRLFEFNTSLVQVTIAGPNMQNWSAGYIGNLVFFCFFHVHFTSVDKD